MRRNKRENNPRFLEAKATIKPIASKAIRKRLKKLQRLARRVQRLVSQGSFAR